jgi:glycine/D-amino acid oxidase-like deaminating enzyme
MKKPSQTDVVVIGAGIIGSSIAYHLARHKLRVTLLERGDIASGSSGACDGLVFLQSKKPGIHLQLAMESHRRFDLLARQLPVPIEYKKTGGMVVIESEDELSAMQQFVKEQQEIGLDVSLTNRDQACKLEPHLSKHILGATHSPLDGQVNPISLTLGFALGAQSLGARLFTDVAVHGIDTTAGKVSAVETDVGRFEADIVINAAGVHAPQIGALVGLDIPIKPRRGQILVTGSCSSMLRHCLISAKYIAAKFNPERTKATGEGVSIEQTENGNFLLGSTREFVGFDKRTTADGLHRIANKTAAIIPALEQVNVIRAFAGLRPHTPDGLPILGQVDDVSGFIMAAGHEGDGIALSPITGELIAQMIATGKSDIPIDAFRLSRFAVEVEKAEVSHV